MKTVIRNGRIVTAVDDYEADILIEDGKVVMIAKEIDVKADKNCPTPVYDFNAGVRAWSYHE